MMATTNVSIVQVHALPLLHGVVHHDGVKIKVAKVPDRVATGAVIKGRALCRVPVANDLATRIVHPKLSDVILLDVGPVDGNVCVSVRASVFVGHTQDVHQQMGDDCNVVLDWRAGEREVTTIS